MRRGLGDGAALTVGVVGVAGGASDWSRGHPRGWVVTVVVSCFGRGVQRWGGTREAAEIVVTKGEGQEIGRAGIGRRGLVRELTGAVLRIRRRDGRAARRNGRGGEVGLVTTEHTGSAGRDPGL